MDSQGRLANPGLNGVSLLGYGRGDGWGVGYGGLPRRGFVF